MVSPSEVNRGVCLTTRAWRFADRKNTKNTLPSTVVPLPAISCNGVLKQGRIGFSSFGGNHTSRLTLFVAPRQVYQTITRLIDYFYVFLA
jgi:hypothetical protein